MSDDNAKPDLMQIKLDQVTNELADAHGQLLKTAAAVIVADASETDLARFQLASSERETPEGIALSEQIKADVFEITKAATQAVVDVYVQALNLGGPAEE